MLFYDDNSNRHRSLKLTMTFSLTKILNYFEKIIFKVFFN